MAKAIIKEERTIKTTKRGTKGSTTGAKTLSVTMFIPSSAPMCAIKERKNLVMKTRTKSTN